MRAFFTHNRSTILRCFIVMFIAFGTLAMIPAIMSGKSKVYLLAGVTALAVSLFITSVLVVLGLIESIREDKFFEKYPYRLIAKNTTKIEYVSYSKCNFAKRFYIFTIDGENFQAAYNSDLIKTPYINLLLIFTKTEGREQQAMDAIAYKEETLDEAALIKRIKNIGL